MFQRKEKSELTPLSVVIDKPNLEDLSQVRNIFEQWVVGEWQDIYLKMISDEIKGQTLFNRHFWVAKANGKAVGIMGLCDPLAKIMDFRTTDNPGELEILYVDGANQGRGIGRTLLLFAEEESRRKGYSELLIRSADLYKDTSYGFYEKFGYSRVGVVINDEDSRMMQVFRRKL